MKCLETETVEMQNFGGDKRQNGKDLRSIGTYLTFADNLLYQEYLNEYIRMVEKSKVIHYIPQNNKL